MEQFPAVDTVLKYAEEKGFKLINKNPKRTNTTYVCPKYRFGCTYTCKVSNRLVTSQTEHTNHLVEPEPVQESQQDNRS
jgi:hypothetical protein